MKCYDESAQKDRPLAIFSTAKSAEIYKNAQRYNRCYIQECLYYD